MDFLRETILEIREYSVNLNGLGYVISRQVRGHRPSIFTTSWKLQ